MKIQLFFTFWNTLKQSSKELRGWSKHDYSKKTHPDTHFKPFWELVCIILIKNCKNARWVSSFWPSSFIIDSVSQNLTPLVGCFIAFCESTTYISSNNIIVQDPGIQYQYEIPLTIKFLKWTQTSPFQNLGVWISDSQAKALGGEVNMITQRKPILLHTVNVFGNLVASFW